MKTPVHAELETTISDLRRELTSLKHDAHEHEIDLKRQLAFETLVAEFSAELIRSPDSPFDDNLDPWLEHFAQALDVDHISFLIFGDNGEGGRFLGTYATPGISDLPVDYQPPAIAAIDAILLDNDVVKWERIPEDLPPGVNPDEVPFIKKGAKSFLAIPMTAEGNVMGAGVFASYRKEMHWSVDIVRRLRFLGEIVAGAQLRAQTRDALLTEMDRRRRLEERNTAALQSSGLGYWVSDLEGRIKEVNDAYCRMVGHSREAVLTMNVTDLDAVQSSEEINRSLNRTTSRGHNSFETRHRHRDGSLVDLEVSAAMLPMENEVYTFFRDITEKKQQERQARMQFDFESLIAEFSATLIRLPRGGLAEALPVWLKRFSKFLGVDRCIISEYEAGGSRLRILYSYAGPGLRPIPPDVVPRPGTGFEKYLRAGKITTYENIPDDLPDDEELRNSPPVVEGTRSLIIIPLEAGAEIVGSLVFGAMHKRQSWSDGIIRRLRLVSQILSNAMIREKTYQTLDRRYRFEQLVSGLSAALMEQPPEELDEVIGHWLGKIAAFLQVERFGINELTDNLGRINPIYEYIDPMVRMPQASGTEKANQAFLEPLLRGEPIIINRVPDDLPREIDPGELGLYLHGTKSFLAVPLRARGEVMGFLAFGIFSRPRPWPDDQIDQIRLIGEIIAGALQRRQFHHSLVIEMARRRELEERNTTILNSTMAGFWIINFDGHIVEVNEALCRLVGFSREELCAMTIGDLDVKLDREARRRFHRRLLARKSNSLVTRFRRKDGGQVDLEMSSSLYPGEERIISFFRDVTAIKAANREVADRLEFEALLSGCSTALIDMPIIDFGQELKKWLERFVAYLAVDFMVIWEFGIAEATFTEVERYHVPEIIAPAEVKSGRPPPFWLQLLLQGKNVKLARMPDDIPDDVDPSSMQSVREGTKSLLAIPLIMRGSVIGAFVLSTFRTYRDWSPEEIRRLRLLAEIFAGFLSRRLMEQERQERLNFEALLADFSAALINLKAAELGDALGIWLKRFVEILDVDRGNVAEFTPDGEHFKLLQSYSAPFLEQIPPDTEPRPVLSHTLRVMNGETFIWEHLPDDIPPEFNPGNLPFIKDGTKSMVILPLGPDQAVIGSMIFSSFRKEKKWHPDVVRRLRMVGEIIANALHRSRAEAQLTAYRDHLEELVEARTTELRAAQDDLIRSERLAALGKITATVSHDLRNPLGTIRTSLFAVHQRLEGAQAGIGPETVLGIRKAVSRAERGVTRCDKIVEELLGFTRVPRLSRTSTRIDPWLNDLLDEEPPPKGIRLVRDLGCGLVVDLDRERLRRCVINILTNGVHAIEQAARPPGEGQLTVTTRSGDGVCEITVQDNGIGIPDSELDSIFEPLYSTKGAGIGLGVPIARQVIEQHGGSIAYDSKAREGTRVMLRLPVVTEP